jgi:hypothetical protein
MALKNVHAFGDVFDLEISRTDAGKINIRLRRDGKPDVLQTVVAGKTVKVEL